MRRFGWLAGLFFCCLCTLCGCGSGNGGTNGFSLDETYTCTVTVVAGDLHWKGELTKDTAGLYSISVLSPDTMTGMEVSSDGNTITLQFQGLKQDLPESEVSDSIFSRLFRTLHTASHPEQFQHRGTTDGAARFTYDGSLGSFYVMVGETGNVKEICYTDRDFCIYIEDYRVKI